MNRFEPSTRMNADCVYGVHAQHWLIGRELGFGWGRLGPGRCMGCWCFGVFGVFGVSVFYCRQLLLHDTITVL